MKKNLNSKEIMAIGNIAYEMPEVQVYEIGIEDSILKVSGGKLPSMGYGEGWD